MDTLKKILETLSIIKENVVNEGVVEPKSDWIAFFGSGSLLGVVVALLLLLVVYIFYRQKLLQKLDRISLVVPFCLVWLSGFAVYDVGMYIGEDNMGDAIITMLCMAPMAIIHAFGMFLLESDVSAVHESCYKDTFFMICFSLVHFLAAGVSMFFVVKHFGFNIMAAIRLYFVSHFGKKRKTLYVFWGMNDPTFYLAQDIEEYRKGSEDYRTIVVRTNKDSESNVTKNGMERLFNFLSLKNEDIDRLMQIDCLTTSTYSKMSQLNNDKEEKLSEMGLKSVVRLIRHKTTDELQFFFLSNNEVDNIKAVEVLKKDKDIKDFMKAGKVVFHCKARYNSVNRLIEDEQGNGNLDVKVVDASHISVELLKKNVHLQPVSYVKVENNATVSTPFNSLVIGFGEVGLDAVRFLYEFGTFVKTGCTAEDVRRSDFHCDVVDKQMESLAGVFVANVPAIKPDLAFVTDESQPHSLVTLHQMDCNSATFYQQLEKWVKNLNYVVITTDDDERNMSLAVRILRMAIRYRDNMERFSIMVRVKHDDDGFMRHIAEHYNSLCKDYKKDDTSFIQPFGLEKDAYTYDNIISERLLEEAKEYFKEYAKANSENDDWDKRHQDAMREGSYGAMMGLRRKEKQDMANSMHKATKVKLFCAAMGIEELNVDDIIRNDKGKEIKYVNKDGADVEPRIKSILDTLAQTEHLRWEASHEILGYRYCEDRDESRLLHDCMKPWKELNNIANDYNVVDVSLEIKKKV